MRQIRIGIYMLLAAGMTALWGACQRSDDNGDTARVTLRLATKAGSALDDENATADEGMKDLQIFLYRKVGDTYQYYMKEVVESVPAEENGSYTVDLGENVQLGEYMFYVIANGASVGMGNVEGEGTTSDKVEQLVIEDEGYFPKKAAEITTNGLPMAGSKYVKLIRSQAVTIPLYRAVAKLDITLENASGQALTVNEINFGAFGADKAFLFGDEKEANVPEDAWYTGISFDGLSRSIGTEEGSNTENFTFYVYPSAAGITGGQTAYTMGLGTSQKTYSPVPLIDADGSELTEMPRNTLYKIKAVVDVDAIRFRDITVDEWSYVPSGGNINI